MELICDNCGQTIKPGQQYVTYPEKFLCLICYGQATETVGRFIDLLKLSDEEFDDYLEEL